MATSTIAASGTASGIGAGSNIVFDGGTLEYTGTTDANTNRTITLNAGGGTLTVDNTATLTASGVISGAGGLTKDGAGTLTLNGVNTYTGSTEISAGTLAGSGTIAGATTLDTGTTIVPGTDGIVGTLTLGGLTIRDTLNNSIFRG